ncbi:MAG: hypothetical protein FJ290_25590 [Planctomycetes bacterium]|nr:hypothetical protein [Planctomycetota bacterium]
MANADGYKLDDLVTEQALIEFFGVRKPTLYQWRRRGLRVVNLDKTHRAYWRQEVADFLLAERTESLPSAAQAPSSAEDPN